MSSALRIRDRPAALGLLDIHRPEAIRACPARWLINGFPATILTWTAEEWARLIDRPLDAQENSNGVWCALRMD